MPQINVSDEEYKSRVQRVRDCFATYVRMTYAHAATGKIKTYEELLKQLHGLDHAYTDALEPYGLAEDLYTDDIDLLNTAYYNDVPLKDFAYQRLCDLNAIEYKDFDPNSLMPPMPDPDDDDDDYDDSAFWSKFLNKQNDDDDDDI